MQVQKHLFRIAEKANRNRHAPLCWKVLFAVGLFFTILLGLMIFLGEVIVSPDAQIIHPCFSTGSKKFLMEKDSIAIVYINDNTFTSHLQTMQETNKKLEPVHKNSYCEIYKNVNSSLLEEQSKLEFTFTRGVLGLKTRERQAMKFQNYTIELKNPPFSRHFYGIENLITMELLNNATQQMVWVDGPNGSISWINDEPKTLLQKITDILLTIFIFGISSISTSLYIYVTIIASPAFILLFLKCTRFGNPQNFLELSKVFPWISMHSVIRQSSSNIKIKNNVADICSSLIMYFVVMYLIYYIIVSYITAKFFDMPSEAGVQELYFGYLAMVEFAVLIFMRTRPFIRYFPVINSLALVMLLFYCKFSLYGFKLLAVLFVHGFGLMVFAWMMLELEVPAQTQWDRTQKYVPTVDRPRSGMLPVFNINWISSLPDEWTLLMPLFSRQHFNEQELAFVDQRYEELNQALNENR